MTKKEILSVLNDKCSNTPMTEFSKGYQFAIDNLLNLINQLPDDSWIRFADQMPTDEDFTNGQILCCDSNNCHVETYNGYKANKWITHWKRIQLPSDPLPTKAEIMEKYNLTEEQLKEIVK